MTANHGCPGFAGSIASARQLSLKGAGGISAQYKEGAMCESSISPQSLVPPYFLGDTYGDIYDKKI